MHTQHLKSNVFSTPGEYDTTKVVKYNGVVSTIHCAGYRVPAKYGYDSNSYHISTRLTTGHTYSVGHMTDLPGRNVIPKTTPRIPGIETHIVRLTGYVKAFHAASDQDYHIDFYGPKGKGIVVEDVAPICTPLKSHFYNQIVQARKDMLALFGTQTNGYPHNLKVTITGLPFYDYGHNETDTLHNHLEIHPLLSIGLG